MSVEKLKYIYSKIKNYGIIPAIKTSDPDKAVFIAKALSSGGLNIAEIAFDTENAAESARKISGAFSEILIAAGNVLTVEQIKPVVGSGAKIIISKGMNENVLSYCENNNIAVIPECLNADDIEKASEMDIDVVKYYVENIEAVKELSAQYPNLKFILAGEINGENILDYLSQDQVMACDGSFIIKKEYVQSHEFDKIQDSAVQIIRKILGFDLAHVVINCENAEQAERDAGKIESIFGLEKTDAGASVSNADIIHFMKSKSYGKNGQIAISSNFLDRAVFYLKEAKKQFIEESARFDGDGKLASIYLDNIIGGFAIKLVRK